MSFISNITLAFDHCKTSYWQKIEQVTVKSTKNIIYSHKKLILLRICLFQFIFVVSHYFRQWLIIISFTDYFRMKVLTTKISTFSFLMKSSCRHIKIKKPKGVFHSFSIKNIFYDKMTLRLFYLDEAIYSKLEWNI